MPDEVDWQCSDCGTLIDDPETRKCPICGGINFYPLADEIPGGQPGSLTFTGTVEEAFEWLESDDS